MFKEECRNCIKWKGKHNSFEKEKCILTGNYTYPNEHCWGFDDGVDYTFDENGDLVLKKK